MTPGPRAASQRAFGTVLSTRNIGDSDRVLDIFARAHGRITVWSKRARSRARGGAHALAPFASAELTLRPRAEGFSLVGHDETDSRAGIRLRLAALQRAGQITSLVGAIFPPHEPAEVVLTGLNVALDHLAAGRVARAAGLYPRLVQAAGLLPSLTHCGRCRRRLREGHVVAAAAALVCDGCVPDRAVLPVATCEALGGARIETAALAQSVEAVVVGWLSWHVGRSLRLGGMTDG